MFHRPFAALLAALVFAVAACGGGDDEASAPATEEAAVLVTRDCGDEVIVEKTDVGAGQTAMQALQRVADVETDDGGKFVTTVEGVEQDTGKKLAWLFYMNGKAAQKGAAEIKLRPGDVEWWDYHKWTAECASVPAEAE